ncbi:hypothetical protein [Clostridium sp.]|uniref:hypothetical protein n=1 Tax=Clostridium sp. TaxID=1506 RepID=UPI001A56B291|nr:hypothetical protein [Clostridium sp.]MBK5236685.1 hypothetical protein [Clostridium sp.]
MDYNKIESKYIKADIKGHYKFVNALEVKKVLKYDFRTMRGFKILSPEHKKLAEILICSFINGHGLEPRESLRPTSIKRERGKFTVHYKHYDSQGFSYLYDSGSVG